MSNFFPYRWLPRTIFSNISYAISTTWQGIKNIIKWAPVIFFDRDYDWVYLMYILEFKFRNMSNRFKDSPIILDWEKQYKQTLTCAELCKRLSSDEYCYDKNGNIDYSNEQIRKQNDLNLLSNIMKKHLFRWWD